MNPYSLKLLQKQQLGLDLCRIAEAEGGNTDYHLDTCIGAFEEICNELSAEYKTPEVKAYLAAAKAAATKARHSRKAGADAFRTMRTFALAGPAITFAADLLDAMLDDSYYDVGEAGPDEAVEDETPPWEEPAAGVAEDVQ